MTDEFLQFIDEIYNIINQPIDIIYKKQAILKYKKKLKISKFESFKDIYNKNFIKSKSKGAVYTPTQISYFIIKNTIFKSDIIKNPFLKIIDPACGCGNILIPCFFYLKYIYLHNLNQINHLYNLNLNKDNIDLHIIKNNLFAYDIDSYALKILTIELFCITGIVSSNLKNIDFLMEDIDCKYDIFLGNPPYIGLKSIDKDYSKQLKKLYKDVYKDKGDISYCFFKKSLETLNKNGSITFITSRYFLESLSGEDLRKVLKETCYVEKIIDFYGIRPFKNASIDPLIIFLRNKTIHNYNIEIIKPNKNKYKTDKNNLNLFFNDKNLYSKFYLNKNLLNNKGWVLRNKNERNIINKIEEKSFTSLNNICESYQGIITGCDKAFVVLKDEIYNENLEKDIIRPWIKSSCIQKFNVNRCNNYLIYSDYIKDEKKYKNTIKHISSYKDKLLNRRECRNGIRKWYELQWGRITDIFEGEKIVFPYKASTNRFALDSGSFFSADIYCLILKKNVPFSYDYLLFLLNSSVYEFYFKTFAKKLGGDMYEYYPNNLMKLCIPTMHNFKNDDELYDFFNFTDEEINIIKNS